MLHQESVICSLGTRSLSSMPHFRALKEKRASIALFAKAK